MHKFFDRKAACDDIKNAIQQIQLGIPTAIWIEGRSGVGKTRLMEFIYNQESELNFFNFMTGDAFYKCERGSLGSSFEYIAAVIFVLQCKNPSFFEKYIQSYFECVEHISFLDACCLVLPQLKGFKAISSLLDSKYKNITAMQGKISDRLVIHQLIDLYSDLILVFLKKIYNTDNVIFCIDDAQWLDQVSLKVFEVLVRKSRLKSQNPIISIFLDIREKSGLNDEETQNYLSTYRCLSILFPNIKCIFLENFDLPTTREIIQETNRYYLIEQVHLLYKITNGNPLELEHTLRLPDEKIRTILQKETICENLNRGDMFSVERIAQIYYAKPIYAVILNILSILRRHITTQLLYQCAANLYPILLDDVCLFSSYSKALNFLEDKEFITRTSFGMKVALKHDSIYCTILDYLSQNGDYVIYSKGIATTLLNSDRDSFLKLESQRLLALKLLCEVDTEECFKQFQKIYQQCGDQLEIEFFLTATEAFCSSYLHLYQENIPFAANILLPHLVSSANLVVAQRLCHTLYWDFQNFLTSIEQAMFLINYIKTQIDLSIVINSEECAVLLFEKLYLFDIENLDLKLQILLLGMSTYEHILNHEKILELFSEAQFIVQRNAGGDEISNYTMALFYRNQGLCFPHSKLKAKYFQALHYAIHISNVVLRHLTFGTSINNLGLYYFYSGKVEKALRAFFFAKKHLTRVGYNTARVSNNIGVCYYMLHDWQNAYYNFSIAASSQTEGAFISLCIQTNLALALFSIGKQSEAKSILEVLINEFKQGDSRSQDTLIYCAAMINRGYIAFKESDYFTAADYYQNSCIHTYRYENDEQLMKRKTMRDICIQQGIGSHEDINIEMDLDDSLLDFYKKPYSLVPFAFYVI